MPSRPSLHASAAVIAKPNPGPLARAQAWLESLLNRNRPFCDDHHIGRSDSPARCSRRTADELNLTVGRLTRWAAYGCPSGTVRVPGICRKAAGDSTTQAARGLFI